MRHSVSVPAAMACALMLAACGGGNRTVDESGQSAGAAADNPLLNSDVRPEPISTTGCLTGSNGRYVVTALDDTAAVPTTITYQLSGGDQAELQKHVNREVRIAGEADPAQVANVREIGTPAVGTTGDRADAAPKADGVNPEVKTQQATRFSVRTVKVSSVTPTGDPCPANQSQPAAR
jgi:hypothetical protein